MAKTKKTADEKGGRGRGPRPRSATAALATEGVLGLVQKTGLAEILTSQIKGKIEEQDFDELVDDAREYLSRNPEVLVISLGALTIATGIVVWLQQRREWDGSERRTLQKAS
jgi:hypothetical protein